MRAGILYYLCLLSLVFCACSGVKYLEDGQKYYDGATIKFKSAKPVADKGKIKPEMEEMLTPKPNAKVLGSRPKVWFYHIAGEPKKEKGLKHWIKTKLGEPPVYFSDVDISRNINLLENKLNNEGFFTAWVDYDVHEGKNANTITYNAHVSEPYRYDTIHFPSGETTLARAIRGFSQESLLEKDQRYDLDQLKEERLRIEKNLKDQGYFYFNDQYILFRADTTIGDRMVDLHMTVKEDTPPQAKRFFRIGRVNVYPEYQFEEGNTLAEPDTTTVGYVRYIHSRDNFRPEMIVNHVRLREGDIYTKEAELVTLNRLTQLDVFKFVNVDFTRSSEHELQTDVYLTPFKKKSLRLELQAVSKSNNFVGPNFIASFRNRNFLRGAELFEFNLTAGYEFQVGGTKQDQEAQQSSLNSYILGAEGILTVPRFITPIDIENKSSRFVPQTKFRLGYRLLQRVDFFRLNSFEIDYGFSWRETLTRRHELYPVSIKYIQLGSISDTFNEILEGNQLLARSYEEQFILGSTYSFFYNSQGKEGRETRTHNFYFNGNIDLSGNLAHLLQSGVRKKENTDDDPYTLLGSPYSQFVKTDIDIRHYWRFNRSSKLATRLIAGIGYAYGNSVILPYTKQFSIGGSSSIRAFRPRSIGPGTFEAPDSLRFIDQTADIKLEGNVEYRFDIVGSFKGAVFVDAGNVWTLKEDESRPGGRFDSAEFYRQIAVGTGVGLRFDVEFFVIRFDLAFPLKVPSDPKWKFSEIAIQSRDWRQQNLILNIAIGYPF